jgi:hypothetical protein
MTAVPCPTPHLEVTLVYVFSLAFTQLLRCEDLEFESMAMAIPCPGEHMKNSPVTKPWFLFSVIPRESPHHWDIWDHKYGGSLIFGVWDSFRLKIPKMEDDRKAGRTQGGTLWRE